MKLYKQKLLWNNKIPTSELIIISPEEYPHYANIIKAIYDAEIYDDDDIDIIYYEVITNNRVLMIDLMDFSYSSFHKSTLLADYKIIAKEELTKITDKKGVILWRSY